MTDNPYQSPQSLELIDLRLTDSDPMSRRGRSAWLTTPVGFLTGTVTIAIAGALGAATLGLFHAIANPSHSPIGEISEIVTVMGMVGGVFGLAGGAIIGTIVGLVAGLAPVRIRKRFLWTTALVAAVYGSAVGSLAGVVLSGFARQAPIWLPVSVLIGGTAGLGGGWILSNVMAWFSWDHLGKKHLPDIPARLSEAIE